MPQLTKPPGLDFITLLLRLMLVAIRGCFLKLERQNKKTKTVFISKTSSLEKMTIFQFGSNILVRY